MPSQTIAPAEPSPPQAPACKHCRVNPANRRRGLCWACYYSPKIRKKYGPVSPKGNRVRDDFQGPAPLPKSPTSALPGSPEKVLILQARFARGEKLFHPEDAQSWPAPEPDAEAVEYVPRAWPRNRRGQLLLWSREEWAEWWPRRKPTPRAPRVKVEPPEQPWLPWGPEGREDGQAA